MRLGEWLAVSERRCPPRGRPGVPNSTRGPKMTTQGRTLLTPRGPGGRDVTKAGRALPGPLLRPGRSPTPLQAHGPVPPSPSPLCGTLSPHLLRRGMGVTAVPLNGGTLTASSLRSGTSKDAHRASPRSVSPGGAARCIGASESEKGGGADTEMESRRSHGDVIFHMRTLKRSAAKGL